MNYIDIIGILSGIITLISFILYFKDKFRKKYIEFENNETFPLFNKKFDKVNLAVLYRGHEIENNVYYFKCKLINCSLQDISNDDLISPIKIHFRNGKILEYHEEKDDKIESKFVISDTKNDVTINWDLFKHKEVIEFSFVVEFSDSAKRFDIYNDIDINYRIRNVNRIIKSGGRYNAKFFYNMLLFAAIAILIIFVYQHIQYPIFNHEAANIQMIEQTYMNITDSSEVVLNLGLSPYQVEKFNCIPSNVDDEYILLASEIKTSRFAYWGYTIMLIIGPVMMVFTIWYFAKKIHSIKQWIE